MYKSKVVILAVVGAIILSVGGYFIFSRASKPPLDSDEQVVVDFLCDCYIDDQLDQVVEEDAERVAAIGDHAVPYLIEAIEKAGLVQTYRTNDRAEMISCLARIGTPRAIDGICMIMEQDFGKRTGNMYVVTTDRLTAAKALVLLGAKDKAGVLKKAIEEQKELEKVQETETGGYAAQVLKAGSEKRPSQKLETALAMLEAGEGQGRIDGLCWVTLPNGSRSKGSRDFLD